MNKVCLDDRGSIVVEMSLVIPLVLWIVVNIIFVFIDSVNDSVLRMSAYTTLYQYDVEDEAQEEADKLLENINEHLVGVYYLDEADVSVDSGEVNVGIDSTGVSGGEIHEYKIRDLDYCTEYDLCSSRLRRWQLYGDILQ